MVCKAFHSRRQGAVDRSTAASGFQQGCHVSHHLQVGQNVCQANGCAGNTVCRQPGARRDNAQQSTVARCLFSCFCCCISCRSMGRSG